MTQSPHEITLEFGCKSIAARRWGSPGGAPVLALHGWLDNCASFDRLAPLLAPVGGDIDLVAIDMAGHGRSYHRSGDAGYNIFDEVEDVVQVSEALDWRRFALLGHSRGAMVSTLTAGAFPKRVQRLALIDGLLPPPARAEEAPEILARAIAQRARYGAISPRSFTDLQQATGARSNGMFQLPEAAARAICERGTVSRDDGITWSSDPRLKATSTAKLTSEQALAFLQSIDAAEIPTRLVLALDGIEGMPARLQPLLQQFPAIAVREMHGGHHLHMGEGAAGIAEWFGPFLRGE